MSDIYAVIDVGTNSTRLLLAEYNSKVHVIEKRLITTRISESRQPLGADNTPDQRVLLSEEGMSRTLDAMDNFCAIAKHAEAKRVFCYATSAVRDAENKETFIKNAKERLDIDIDVISGESEAELAFLGALGKKGEGCLIDIGGGSTELIFGKDGRIALKGSVPIGCIKLKNMFPDDVNGHTAVRNAFRNCPTEYSVMNKRGEFETKSKNAKALLASMRKLGGTAYAVGGTATTLCALAVGLSAHYDGRLVQNRALTHGEARQILHELGGMPIERRRAIPILKDRADIICFGASLLLTCMDALDVASVTVSDSDGLEGYLIRSLE